MSNRRVREAKKQVEYTLRRNRGHFNGIPAQVIGEELDRICKQNGGTLEASKVVDEARDKNAPLHPAFEWDDSKAAEEYRVGQARMIIRVVIRTDDADGNQSRTRQYIHIPKRLSTNDNDSREGSYHPISAVIESPDLYAAALSALSAKLRAANDAVEELQNAAIASKTVNKNQLAAIEILVQTMQAATAAVASLH